MGVHGLWKLIDAAGKPVPVETLENKILAVDVSIWLHQLVKGFQDVTGGGANAHLLGLFLRICKLLFFRIKPIFVFDGGVPTLKRRTILARQAGRTKASESSEQHRQELIYNLLKQHAIGMLLGKDVKLPHVTPTVQSAAAKKQDSMFDLPPIPSTSSKKERVEQSDSDESGGEDAAVALISSSSDDYDDEEDAGGVSKKYGDIHSINVNSDDFKALPADMRHDILSELKETRKQNSWAKLHLMPDAGTDFSDYQMKRLLKRRSVQVGLEEAEKEMGPRGFTMTEIKEILEYQGVEVTQRIAADENTRFIYSDIKKPSNVKDEKVEAKLSTVVELDEDSDDPLLDAMVDQEGISQEEIMKLIQEQSERKKLGKKKSNEGLNQERGSNPDDADDNDGVVAAAAAAKGRLEGGDGGNASERNVNEPYDQIAEGGDNGGRAWKPGPGKISLVERKKHFDDRAVSNLLRESAKKHSAGGEDNSAENSIRTVSDGGGASIKKSGGGFVQRGIVPISKVSLDGKSKRIGKQRKKPIRKVFSDGPNLSESSDSDDEPVSGDPLAKSNPSRVSSQKNAKNPSRSHKESSSPMDVDSYFDGDDDLFQNVEIPDVEITSQSKDSSEPLAQDVKRVSRISESKIDADSKTSPVQIVLKLDDPLEDEEDIFKDVFETNKPTVQQISSSDDDFEEVKEEDLSSSSGNEQEIPSLTTVNISSSNDNKGLDSSRNTDIESVEMTKIKRNDSVHQSDGTFVEEQKQLLIKEGKDDKENLLEELQQTASKLKEEMKSGLIEDKQDDVIQLYRRADLDDGDRELPLKTGIGNTDAESNLPRTPEKRLCESEASLEEKNYFGPDQLVLSPKKRSPESFAKELTTVDQVRQFQSTLERESAALITERRREERVAATVTEQVTNDAQELLRLFGIPWVVAPMEAEAQCAYLDLKGYTQGTITDDSDIWLFGANNVYKNFFDQKKFVKLFKSNDIKRVYNLGREELIMIGLLVGSDYTLGLSGVGPVTALEIVANYPPDESDLIPSRDRLARFAENVTKKKIAKRLAKKLSSVILSDGFPSVEVVRAYTDPLVDDSSETFSWGRPNMDSLRQYAMEKFGWPADKTTKTLEPIFNKLSQDKTQTTLHGFFNWAFDGIESKMSRRVEKAVSLLASPSKISEFSEEEDNPNEVAKHSRVVKAGKKRSKKKSASELSDATEPSTSAEVGPSTNEESEAGPLNADAVTPSANPSSAVEKRLTLRREVNHTIELIKKGKLALVGKKRKPKESFLMKPHPLDMEGPFDVVELPKRKKIARTDDEKLREIEEARAKAARVREKLKRQHTEEEF